MLSFPCLACASRFAGTQTSSQYSKSMRPMKDSLQHYQCVAQGIRPSWLWSLLVNAKSPCSIFLFNQNDLGYPWTTRFLNNVVPLRVSHLVMDHHALWWWCLVWHHHSAQWWPVQHLQKRLGRSHVYAMLHMRWKKEWWNLVLGKVEHYGVLW